MRARWGIVVATALAAFACERRKSEPSEPTVDLTSAPSASAPPTSSAAPGVAAASVDIFAQPSASASAAVDPMAPYLQKKIVKISHVAPIEVGTHTTKKEYARVAYHLEVLAVGPPKAAVFGRARCRMGDENMVDDGYRFDELERLAPGESMALYADFFSYPGVDHAPHQCTVVFSYHPSGRYARDQQAPIAAFCVDTEKVSDGECKE